ncbi:hypothetical protein HPB50_010710 [Hyalomma asiaticum]|uniref:Uncharacterized protein n=1 Tax=Hyalomma asiaticum TaxID=266040 RepID=A0ACB7SGN4_HYAAI|nr:hypothetical protein HPB50_010710 [Hyalomma asiaticum]
MHPIRFVSAAGELRARGASCTPNASGSRSSSKATSLSRSHTRELKASSEHPAVKCTRQGRGAIVELALQHTLCLARFIEEALEGGFVRYYRGFRAAEFARKAHPARVFAAWPESSAARHSRAKDGDERRRPSRVSGAIASHVVARCVVVDESSSLPPPLRPRLVVCLYTLHRGVGR